MKPLVSLALGMLLIAFSGSPAPAHEGVRVGIIDADRALQTSLAGKAFLEEYQRGVDESRAEVEALVEAYRAKQKDFQAKAASLSEDRVKQMRLELERMQVTVKRTQEDASRSAQKQLNVGLEGFRKRLHQLVRQVAVERKLDIVLTADAQSGLVYFNEKVDITGAVVARWDQSYRQEQEAEKPR